MTLPELQANGLDETASKRSHNYVTVFIDLDRTTSLCVCHAGQGQETVKDFSAFLREHQGKADDI